MAYRTKDKTRMEFRLSPWMYNGMNIIAAKYGMTMSDVVRVALKEHIEKELDEKERSFLSGRDDMVDEIIENYEYKGRAGKIPTGYDDKEHMEELVKKSEMERYPDEEEAKEIDEKYRKGKDDKDGKHKSKKK